MCFTNAWEYLSTTRAFHEKRCTRKFRFKQKRNFLIKKSCILPSVLLLLPIMCRLDGNWGHFTPFPTLISATTHGPFFADSWISERKLIRDISSYSTSMVTADASPPNNPLLRNHPLISKHRPPECGTVHFGKQCIRGTPGGS